MSIDWPRFVEMVNAADHFLLTSHMRPDCDALGSELGMAAVLELLGKHVTIVNADPIPAHLEFIDPEQRIKVLGRDVQPDTLPAFDVMMVLDTSAWAQLGPMADLLRDTKASRVVLDHHVSQDDLGAELFKDPDADSTGRLVLQAAEKLGVVPTQPIALPLFAAMATDTGWFRFSSVSGETFRAAATLIDCGVRPESVYHALYEQNSLARLRLRGRILSAIESHLNGRLLVTCVTRQDFDVTGAKPGDTEDVVNMLLSVADSQVAVILQEQADGRVKASLRSSAVDVRKVAERFGGGGHTAAAGVMLKGPFDLAKKSLLDALRETMR